MKQKDIALFVVVAVVSAVFSVMLSNYLITPAKDKKQTASVVEPISKDFNTPEANDKFINTSSINPTRLIQIGDESSNNPASPTN